MANLGKTLLKEILLGVTLILLGGVGLLGFASNPIAVSICGILIILDVIVFIVVLKEPDSKEILDLKKETTYFTVNVFGFLICLEVVFLIIFGHSNKTENMVNLLLLLMGIYRLVFSGSLVFWAKKKEKGANS